MNVKDLEEIAAPAIREALEQYYLPNEIRNNLVLGILFEDPYRIFELYVPGERPEDAVVIATAVVNAIDGIVEEVEITGLQKKEIS